MKRKKGYGGNGGGKKKEWTLLQKFIITLEM